MKRAILAALVISLAAGADPLLPDGGIDCDTPTKFEVFEVAHGTAIDKQGHLIGLTDALCEPKVTAVCSARRVVACEAENASLKDSISSGPPPWFVGGAAALVVLTAIAAFTAGKLSSK